MYSEMRELVGIVRSLVNLIPKEDIGKVMKEMLIERLNRLERKL